MRVGNSPTFYGFFFSLSEEGEVEKEGGGSTVSSAGVLQRFVLLSLRKHFITLPPSLPLSLLLSSEQRGA